MADKGPRVKVRMKSSGKTQKGKATGYFVTTTTNQRNNQQKQQGKLRLNKFDPRAWDAENGKLGCHVEFVEDKIK